MQCIGEIDENKTFLEQIDDYEVNGYKVSDLKPEDKSFIEGMAYAINALQMYEPNFSADTGSDILDSMISEIGKSTLDEAAFMLIGEVGMSLFSIMDNDEDYWEKDPEEDNTEE